MTIHLFHPIHFEKWDYRNLETGIGGSETHQIEMAWRLAKRGFQVISYAPLREDTERIWRGTEWRDLEEVDFQEPGLWVIYRAPAFAKRLKPAPDRKYWLLCQDEDYYMTKAQGEKFSRVVVLCKAQGEKICFTKPFLKEKIWQSSNGIRLDLIAEVEAEGRPERNPLRLTYASSPDRGLLHVLRSFQRAKEFLPELTLSAFYGFDNIEKLKETHPALARDQEKILQLAEETGAEFRGRISQKELYREWLKTGIWLYQTNFTETSCITSMEAQALGAIPIVNPIWALAENVIGGVFIRGDAWGDRLVAARYVGETVRLGSQPWTQEIIRFGNGSYRGLMSLARERFNWERIVDQWEKEL